MLQEKTLEIRNQILEYENNSVNFIIGKPGVGKSHFAKELKIKNIAKIFGTCIIAFVIISVHLLLF